MEFDEESANFVISPAATFPFASDFCPLENWIKSSSSTWRPRDTDVEVLKNRKKISVVLFRGYHKSMLLMLLIRSPTL